MFTLIIFHSINMGAIKDSLVEMQAALREMKELQQQSLAATDAHSRMLKALIDDQLDIFRCPRATTLSSPTTMPFDAPTPDSAMLIHPPRSDPRLAQRSRRLHDPRQDLELQG